VSVDLEALIAEVRSSTRYRAISPALVSSVVQAELRKQRSHRETVKAVKTKLHQMVGVFLDGKLAYPEALEGLRAAAGDPAALRSCCSALMAGHTSTRERLPILEPFYRAIFDHLGPVHSILDLGCGLNPLAIPWMPLAEGCSYHAYDVHADLIQFLAAALPLTGVDGGAHLAELTQETVGRPADLALLLKCLPTLDQLDRSAAARLLSTLRVKQMVISFPLRSLGGHERGMRANYATRFQQLIAGRPWQVERLEFPTELVYLVTTSPSHVW
jgi:16S rRNA (guanine(1405)-N(7))-methyltransferase